MKPTPSLADPAAAVACAVAARATVRVPLDAIGPLRQRPGPGPGERLPAGFLKHADEQTVAALAAVFQAIDRHGLGATAFTDWGVVAAPRFLGRATLAAALQRFALEGAWGVSPHLIPHRSLHAISGTVSQALGIHGPNFGVGGGPHGAAEALLAAAALFSERRLPGLWLVLSGLDPEPVLDRPGQPPANGHKPACACLAVALALLPAAGPGPGLRVGVGAGPAVNGRGPAALPLLSLEGLWEHLDVAGAAPAAWRLGTGGWVELDGLGTAAEGRP